MHRAGTSALARVLALRGANLPAEVLPPNSGNVRGYWEPRGVVELNDRILDACDTSWDDPFASHRLAAMQGMQYAYRAEAVAVLEREYGDAELIVLKDPRCTLLREFWCDALRARGFEPRPVAIMRPCPDVAASLVRRDATSAESAAWLYVAYGLEVADAVAAGASMLTYDQLVGDWRASTDRIAAEQGVPWPIDNAEASAQIDAYLDPAQPAAPTSLPPPLGAWSEQVWDWCRRAAQGDLVSKSELRDPARGMANMAEEFSPLFGDRLQRLRMSEAAHADAIRERDTVLRVYRETDERLRRAQDAHAEMELRLESEKAELADEIQRVRSARAEAETERDSILGLYRRTDELLQQAQLDYQQRDRDYVAARSALDDSIAVAASLHGELDAMRRSQSWRLTAPLRALMRRLRGELPWWPLRSTRTTLPQVAPPSAADVLEPRDDNASSPRRAKAGRAPVHRDHAALRRFLVGEFGEATAADSLRRIEHYRLPVAGDEVRAAARLECSEEQALEWARDIARRAPAMGENPDVSVIIPVYNQLPFTLACIDALLAHDSRHSFEILVGDDASTDATAAALSLPMPGVRHVRHASNLGFLRNCNTTASHARGRYVLFLNNDTLVLPGWLDELVATLEADDGIGLAGSKLIFPDGRLQECGAIVWRDGSAWNFGRGSDPRRPEFCYLRDVDYVSGASILLRRALWESLGGFDELFVPAYAEDADLAFRVRDRGLRTVVQPLSQLLHFEGVSSGTDLGSGAKAYQIENLRKLRARWAHVLAGHRDNADSPELEKERGVARRVLFVDHCTPTPNEDAGSLVATEVMRAFGAHGYKVTFVPEDNFAHMGGDTRALQRAGIESIYHPAYSRMSAFIAARNDPFDVVFLHRFGVGEAHMRALRRKFPRAKVVFLNADMHFLREMREAELNGGKEAMASAMRTRARELEVVSRADVTLVHSEFERELLRGELPGADIRLFPLIHDPVGEAAPLQGREGVCFVGGFRHPPNADGIRWFVDEAWPLVLREAPDAMLRIVGSHMPAEVKALGERPGVEAVGFVADLGSFLDRQRVSVAPLRYGAGAKGKVAESLARGLPMVCTPVAAEGMGLEPGRDLLVGESAQDLAANVVELLRDDRRWLALSQAGIAYAREVTSRARARDRIGELLSR